MATWLGDVARLLDCRLGHPDLAWMIVNGHLNNTRIKPHDPNWAFLGYRPHEDAEDHVEMLRAQGMDVDSPAEWPEQGCSHAGPR